MNDTNNVGVSGTQTPGNVVNTPAPVAPPVNLVQQQPAVTAQPVSPVAPVQAAPVTPAPVQPAPVQAAPAVQTPVAPQPVQAPVASPTVAPAAVSTPVQPAPVQAAPAVQAPVAPQPVQTPVVEAPQAPTAQGDAASGSKVEVQLADNIKIEIDEKKKEKERKKKEKKEKASNMDEDEEGLAVKANRYPIILAVVFVSILLLMFVYYYLVMTPYNVFDSALSSMVDAIKDMVEDFGEDDSERNTFDLQFELITDTEQFANNPEQSPTDYINGDHIEGIVNFDTQTKGFSINLLADKLATNLPEGVVRKDNTKKYENMLNAKFYSFKDNMYIGPFYYVDYNDKDAANKTPIELDKTVQIAVETENINVNSFTIDSLKDAADLIDLIIEKGKTTVFDSDLKRGIVFKKVGDSTAIALKANCDTHEEMVDRVFHGTFDDEFINRKDVIDLTKKVFGFDDEQAKELLLAIHDRPIDFTHLDINLYMNLANTELISFDMTFDEKVYVQLDYLRGFYNIVIRVMTDGKVENDKFNITATYDRDNGIVDGLGIINNDNTYLAVKFDYNRKINTTGEKTGNELKFRFYNNETHKLEDESKQKPFCILNCTLEIYESNDDPTNRTNFDLEAETKGAYVLPLKNGIKTSSGITIKSTLEGAEAITIQEGNDIKAFFGLGGDGNSGFMSHIDYLVEHLLYNREGALARREAAKNGEDNPTEEETKQEETKQEEEKVEENTQKNEETVDNTNKVEENTNNTNTDTTNENTNNNSSENTNDDTSQNENSTSAEES